MLMWKESKKSQVPGLPASCLRFYKELYTVAALPFSFPPSCVMKTANMVQIVTLYLEEGKDC